MRIPESTKGRVIAGIVGVLVAAGVYMAYKTWFPEIDLQGLLNEFANFLGQWTYLVIGVLSFLETGAFVGLLVPGETALLVGGAVAGQGVINVYLLIAIAWSCAFLGDSTSFYLGHRLGRDFVLRHGSRVGITRERFESVEDYFDKHGGKTVLIGRFVGLVRALSPFVAGSSNMRYAAFAPYSILGSGLQVTAHIMVGYLFSRSIEAAAEYAGLVALWLAVLIVTIVVIVYLYRHFREPANRVAAVEWLQEHGATRWMVSLGRRLDPQYRFVKDRLTPGTTFGLEFTTLCAVMAVASFVLIALGVVTAERPGPTPGDTTASDFVDLIRNGWLTDITKVITVLGSSVVTLPLTFAAAAYFAFSGRWPEFIVLALATVAIYVGVDVIKDWVARPRPPDPIADYAGYAYPSGHAAHSVYYVWLSVIIAVRIRTGRIGSLGIFMTGLAITILVGLSRVYLGVHYLSDVSGGWALGAFSFAFFSAAALVWHQLRQN